MKVKVCGLKEPGHALAAAQAGADFVGLVFYSGSPRAVTLEQARRVVDAVRARTQAPAVVGVFVNEAPREVNRIARSLGLDFVQLSGDEPWDYCRNLDFPVIKAVRLGPDVEVQEMAGRLGEGLSLAGRPLTLLLDAREPGLYGGTGRAFDWSLARALAATFPFLLAGGLTPRNVGRAVREVQPWGLDVSSGVETRGAKDAARIRAFLRAARRAETQGAG